MSEPILHLARRIRKAPETAKPSEIRALADWVLAAYRQKLDELNSGRIIEPHRAGAETLLERSRTGG